MSHLFDPILKGSGPGAVATAIQTTGDGALHVRTVDGSSLDGIPPAMQLVAAVTAGDGDTAASDTVEILTSGGATTTEVPDNDCYTMELGTGSGDAMRLATRRTVRSIAGGIVRADLALLFETGGIADSVQRAGLIGDGCGAGVGYNGTAFGVFRRYLGKRHVVRFTITVPAGGAEDITVELNGVSYGPISITGTTEAKTAAQIALDGTIPAALWEVTFADNLITCVAKQTGVKAGANSLSSTGVAAATVATHQTGEAAVDSWVALTRCDDPLDGTGASGATLVLANIQAFRVELAPGRSILWSVWLAGAWVPFHTWAIGNVRASPDMHIGSMAVAVEVQSVTSITNIVVQVQSLRASATVLSRRHAPFGAEIVRAVTVGATEYQVITLQSGPIELKGMPTTRTLRPRRVVVMIDGNVAGRAYVRVDADLTYTTDYSVNVAASRSVALVAFGADTTAGGLLAAVALLAPGVPAVIDLSDIVLERNQTISIGVVVPSGTATAATGVLEWTED